MSVEIPDHVCITTRPTFGELYSASLLSIRYQGWLIIFHTVFPLVGLFFLMTPLMGYRLGPVEILVAAMCFSFTPLITAFAVWAAGRNKLVQGPFTYTFDTEGMQISGSAFDARIRWSAILRVRLSKRFLFVFISPVRAHCIPLHSLANPEVLARFRNLAIEHTDFR